jgi:hypothetical protein
LSSSPPNPPPITLDDIDTGVAVVEEVENKSALDRLEEERLEEARLRNELARARIENVNADRQMRKTYASRILRYLEIYSIVVAAFLIASGFKLGGFVLPDGILVTLVGSTAVAAIGLVGFIARGLFPPPPQAE